MKKILSLLFVLSISLFSFAEDVISVMPFETQPGVTHDSNKFIEVKMVNAEEDVFTAFQFDLYLPVGMKLDNTLITSKRGEVENDPLNLTDRCPVGEKFVSNYNPLTSDKQGYVLYRVLVYNSNNWAIYDKEGTIIKLQYLTENTLAPGVYPIYVNNVVIATAGGEDGIGGASNDVRVAETTSYVKVGSPTISKEFPVEFKGFLPSFVLDELKKDVTTATTSINLLQVTNIGGATEASALSGLYKNKNCLVMIEPTNIQESNPVLATSLKGTDVTNTINGSGSIKKLVLVDGYDFAVPSYYPDTHISVTAGTATYTRSNIKSKYNTVSLPFTPTSFNGTLYSCSYDEFNTDDASGIIKLEPLNYLTGTTSVFTTDDSEVVFTSDVSCLVSTVAGGNNYANRFYFLGTFEKKDIDDPNTYYIKSDKVYHVNEYFTLNAFRGYFKAAGINAKSLSFVIEGDDATAIESISANDIDAKEVFDLSGRKIGGIPAKGIYIVNGKKTWIK